MANKPGRPRLANPRSKVIQFRISEGEFDEIRLAAERDSQSVSDFCRDTLIDLAMAINAGELDETPPHRAAKGLNMSVPAGWKPAYCRSVRKSDSARLYGPVAGRSLIELSSTAGIDLADARRLRAWLDKAIEYLEEREGRG